jgi:nitrogen-specific signal transduction histidine kinase/ActR/RegA family two-component response regulator
MLHQSGRTLWINKTISVARNWADKPDYLICVIEDITERQQLRQQLHHAQKMEAVGRLSASIAHDFNNLLTAIRGFGELALVKFGDHPAADDLAEVVQATQRASDLTRRLLGFSRMSVIQPHVLDLNTVLAQLESLLRRLLASNIELTFWLADDLWPVKADISELEQILVNLAINAGDAMPSGGQLLIGTTNMASESTVRLTVTDTGHGMTDEVLARLFEPFFTTKAMGKGTGLGLSTVHDIVTASGGQIMVTSALGQGTTFQIDLPRADQPALIPAAAGEVEATTTESSVVYPRTVLIAEDETSIQLMMERYLSRFGYQILSANDGLEALQIGREHDGPIDLLLTDMSMAGLTGDQLARQLTTCLPNLKVLYITGSPDRIKPDMLNGKADFLLKPFDIDNLAAKVQTLLEPMKANHLKLGLERKHSF